MRGKNGKKVSRHHVVRYCLALFRVGGSGRLLNAGLAGRLGGRWRRLVVINLELRFGGLSSGGSGLSGRLAGTFRLLSRRDIRFNNRGDGSGLNTTLRKARINGAQEGEDVGKALVVVSHG